MTLKLFYDDPYLSAFDAKVTSLQGNQAMLGQTVFFAFSGGQASDAGTIDGIEVERAECVGDDILYTLREMPLFKEGDQVRVSIDPERRTLLMRLHSATHLVFILFEKLTGISKQIGSNVEPQKGRIDYAYDTPINDLLPGLEGQVNGLIAQDLPIQMGTDPADPAIRLWKMGEWTVPCSGTHVRRTGEIGPVQLRRKNIGRGKERIEITLLS